MNEQLFNPTPETIAHLVLEAGTSLNKVGDIAKFILGVYSDQVRTGSIKPETRICFQQQEPVINSR